MHTCLSRTLFSTLVLSVIWFLPLTLIASISEDGVNDTYALYPSNNSINVNVDIPLSITFATDFELHNSGKIRVYDAATDEMIDELDLSIPPGPKNTRTPAPYDAFIYENHTNELYSVRNPDTVRSHIYQKKFLSGGTDIDAYHFYPILISNKKATIHLHHTLLPGKTYYIIIDEEVFSVDGRPFDDLSQKGKWSFTTKSQLLPEDALQIVVSADGHGDFNTVQGAIDHLSNDHSDRRLVRIMPGRYEEIVYFRGKSKISFIGHHKDSVLICYPNNGVFNNKPIYPEEGLTYHNRRSVFGLDNSSEIQISNMTIRSIGEAPAQAEALLVKGDKIVVSDVNIEGSGDALQATGRIYIQNSKIQGYGDNVLGYGAVFFKDCDFVSTYGPHMWIRNSNENHGNVCLNCTFRTVGDVETTIARTNDNKKGGYPYCEAVLINCKMEGVRPEGWGVSGKGIDHIHYWEYNSVSLTDGRPVDITGRDSISRQLSMEEDSMIIANYSKPEFVLDSWSPSMIPYLKDAIKIIREEEGNSLKLECEYAALAVPKVQWYKDGKPISSGDGSELGLNLTEKEFGSECYLELSNELGTFRSQSIYISKRK